MSRQGLDTRRRLQLHMPFPPGKSITLCPDGNIHWETSARQHQSADYNRIQQMFLAKCVVLEHVFNFPRFLFPSHWLSLLFSLKRKQFRDVNTQLLNHSVLDQACSWHQPGKKKMSNALKGKTGGSVLHLLVLFERSHCTLITFIL